MKEILRIDMILDRVYEVQGARAKIKVISFHGKTDWILQ